MAKKKDEKTVLEDNQLVCILSNKVKKISNTEESLQSIIRMLNEEYSFELSNMERDFTITYVDLETGKNKKQKVDLVIFENGSEKEQENITRIVIVHDSKIKETDKKKGVEATLENALGAIEGCEFGLWSNGHTYNFMQKEEDVYGNDSFVDLSDFPGEGQTLEDIDRHDRSVLKNPAGDSLVKVFKRCHDYIYGNEGMKKTAFWELLNLIFCKLYDEKRRFSTSEVSYRRKFWVGVKEQNSEKGRKEVAKRIKSIFNELKDDELFSEVFDGNEKIHLTDKGLAFVASELSRYSFLDATVDVKGTAYETIVSNTLKQEAGQFFTPRNIVKFMVEMMDPDESDRVLDPACGSGGFLVMVLDHVRNKITKKMFKKLSGPLLEEKLNSFEVNNKIIEYAEKKLFGFDFDPDLKKAARMNMVMAGDGHANIFHANSLAYPHGDNKYELNKIIEQVSKSVSSSADSKKSFKYKDAREKFDLIFTNPPFGAKIPINDPDILSKFDLGHSWKKNEMEKWERVGLSTSEPPEVLFIELCYQFLKPGGRVAIVLPDGILGNPRLEYLRVWILERFRLLASIDLPVEAFLPQVGVQASILFLQKKTDKELKMAKSGEESYNIFFAVADLIGKDRRGEPIYVRDQDGSEIYYERDFQYLSKDSSGIIKVKSRKEKVKKIADDLVDIVREYREQIRDGQ